MKKTPHCAGATWWKGDTTMKRNSMSMMACLQDSSLNLHCLDLEVYKMSEGRKTQVVLLDDRLLDIITQPKLYAGELLDIVASHFNLKEKEYFGLSFKDDTGHHHWLQQDRRVLEHDFPRKNGPLVLYFAVRFFIETIAYLRDNPTIELFFLQSKQAIYRGQIECDSDTVFELAAYALQVTDGNYTNDATAKKCLKSLPLLPTSALQEHPSIEYCEEQVLGYYRSLAGQSRGSAIVNYMNIVENLPTYGVHYYEVKDKSSIPWWLGLGYQGISLYDYTDKKVPRRVFAWKQLENLYFRDKKFSIEVHDPKRIVHALSSFNLYEDAIHEPLEEFDDLSDAISDPTTQVSVSRRTFSPGNVNVHAWFATTPQLTKCIWSMAVSQHQFYLDRKQSKSQIPQMRSMTDIATELCRSTSSLQNSATSGGSGGISRSNSCHSLSVSLSTHNSKAELTVDDVEASRAAHRDMFAALKARRDLLEESVRKKTEELKALCIKEGELTGKLPKDIPLAPGEPMPHVRKRVRTGFTLSPQIIDNHASDNEANLSKLELEFDVQDKIVKAAHQLAQDKTIAKSVRKKRKQSYHRAVQKLKDLEKTLNDYRRFAGKTPVAIRGSVEDLSDDSRDYLEEADPLCLSPVNSPAMQHHLQEHCHYGNQDEAQVKIIASPKVEVVEMQQVGSPHYNHLTPPQGSMPHPGSPCMHHSKSAVMSRGSTPSPGQTRRYFKATAGYQPSAVYTTKMPYRNQSYPTFTSQSSTQSEYDNLNGSAGQSRHGRSDQEVIHNLYNINTHSVTTYSSTDELKSERYDDYDESECMGSGGRVPPKHGCFDSAHELRMCEGSCYDDYSSQPCYGGSLERNSSLRLSNLTPSKFGSKRESHTDYKDSPFQYVDMPSSGGDAHVSEYMARAYPHLQQEEYGGIGHVTQSGVPIIDGLVSRSATNWMSDGSHQGAPCSAQFVVGGGPENAVSPMMDSSHRPMVKQCTSYVEVSKPFEMADVYKYSERLRKQRVSSQASSSIASDSPVHTPQRQPSPFTQRMVPAGGGYQNPPPYTAPTSPTSQQSSRSRPHSPYSSSSLSSHDGSYSSSSYIPSPYHQNAQKYGTAQHGMYQTYQSATQNSPYHQHQQYPPRPPVKLDPNHGGVSHGKLNRYPNEYSDSDGYSPVLNGDDGAWYKGRGAKSPTASTLV